MEASSADAGISVTNLFGMDVMEILYHGLYNVIITKLI